MPLQLRPAALLLATTGQLCVLGVAEVLRRRGVRAENTRRIAHAAGAAGVVVLVRFLSLEELATLAVFFTGLLGWTMWSRRLAGIHDVRRPTLGALVLPSGLLLGAWVGWGHPAAIAYGALVLGLADPSAALAGERLGGPGWPVVGGRKTAAGSAAFLLVALGTGLALTGLHPARLPFVLLSAAVLTAVEGAVGYGLDNLPLPPLAGFLALTWLGL